MGLKQGAIENPLGEHIGNLMGTHWELEGKMLGTKKKWRKIPHFLPHCYLLPKACLLICFKISLGNSCVAHTHV